MVELRGQGVWLRPLIEEDLPKLWETVSKETFQFMLNQIETYEQFAKWQLDGIRLTNETENCVSFAVIDAKTNTVCGATRIYLIDHKNKSCEIGATFYGDAYRRTHVNTETKLLLLTYAFEQLHMIRVQLRADEQNVASQRAIERIGAMKEGVLRNERIRSNGVARNAVLYSIIDREWPTVRLNLNSLMNKYAKKC